jgi:hypothetical protein
VAAYAGNSAVTGQPAAPLLALAVLAGSLSHVLADGLTVAGVPLWWPFRRRRNVFLGALAFRTRSLPRSWSCSAWSPGSAGGSPADPWGFPPGRPDQYRSSSVLTSGG